MYVKPSNSTPAALRKARWERDQAAQRTAQVQANAAAQAAVVKATVK